MQLQIQCQRCNKTERLDIDQEESNDKARGPSISLGIPMPNVSNGLKTYSIAHQDHTLILDVDNNGAVRGEKIIDRIDQGIEKTLAAAATKVLELYILNENRNQESLSLFFISPNRAIHKLLLGVFSHLMFNIPAGTQSVSSISATEALLEFDNLTVYVGSWQKKIYNFRGDRMVSIYELDENSASNVKLYLKKDKEHGITDSAIMFSSDFIATSEGKEAMTEIFQIAQPQALDMSNADRAAHALFSIITSSLL